MRIRLTLLAPLLVLMATGCATEGLDPSVMTSPPREVFPTTSAVVTSEEYRIRPFDELSITVFQEDDLSLEGVPVDASGNILFPLIGLVEAKGMTSREVAALITNKLASRFLVDPQVLVNITKSSSEVLTVEGSVIRPGRIEMSGQMTLLTAIASAQGPTPTARLDEVLVFRNMDGQRYAARFDLAAIRAGRAEDPLMRGDDIVVIGASNAKTIFRDILLALPGIGTIFIALQQN